MSYSLTDCGIVLKDFSHVSKQMYPSLSFALTAELENEQKFQTICMRNISTMFSNSESVCYAEGVKCDNNELLIEFSSFYGLCRINQIDWFPPSLEKLMLDGHSIPSLKTQTFPRSLMECVIDNCQVEGSIHMNTLPRKLVFLSLRSNLLKGALSIMQLPITMKEIDLRRNNLLKKVLLDPSSLPDSLEAIRIIWPSSRIAVKTVGGKPMHVQFE